MDPELKELFENTRCLTEHEMLQYLKGELTQDERRRVEIHLAGCQLCIDALEGLSQVQPQSQIPSMVKQVNDRITLHLKRHARKRKALKLYILLSFTVFLVLIIILVAYMSFHFAVRQHQIHDHKPVPANISAPAPDTNSGHDLQKQR